MASRLCFRAKAIPSSFSFSSSSSSTLRRRLLLFGAFCVLSFGLPNLLSAACRATVCTPHSLPSAPLLRSNFGSQAKAIKGVVAPLYQALWFMSLYPTKKFSTRGMQRGEENCTSLIGIQSIYQWEGEVQTDSEELLIIKTRQSLFEALTEHVKSNHPYDVPEVIALPVNAGSFNYLEWIKNSTRD